ncbi:MAG: hypothetical protein HYS44_00150 [Candidatus Niyogibacteria bacterium]|nr:hypothetical protein [Candidatus Niyogibacteria bacterium]
MSQDNLLFDSQDLDTRLSKAVSPDLDGADEDLKAIEDYEDVLAILHHDDPDAESDDVIGDPPDFEGEEVAEREEESGGIARTIILDQRPTLCGLFAAWLVYKFKLDFEDAEIVFGHAENGDTAACYDLEGVRSAAALKEIAEGLGVLDMSELQPIFRLVEQREENRAPSHAPLHFENLTAALVEDYIQDGNPVEGVEWFFETLDRGFYKQQEKRAREWSEAEKEFELTATVKGLPLHRLHGRALTFATICSDDPVVSRLARAKRKADVVIQQQGTGHVQIGAVEEWAHIMPALARLVRVDEWWVEHSGRRLPYLSRELEQRGRIGGIPQWFFPDCGFLLLNGTPNNMRSDATKLTLDHIVELVEKAAEESANPRRTAIALATPSRRFERRV